MNEQNRQRLGLPRPDFSDFIGVQYVIGTSGLAMTGGGLLRCAHNDRVKVGIATQWRPESRTHPSFLPLDSPSAEGLE